MCTRSLWFQYLSGRKCCKLVALYMNFTSLTPSLIFSLLNLQGCTPCDCGLASDSTQCDDVTGQCRCKPGVTGRTCDRCKPGYWNYGPDGCVCKYYIFGNLNFMLDFALMDLHSLYISNDFFIHSVNQSNV